MRPLLGIGLFALCALPSAVDAQTGKVVVYGRVEDAVSGDPIGYALILAADSSDAIVADSAGYFAIQLDRSAPFMVQAEQFAYEPTVFELPEDAPDKLSVLPLPPAAIEIEGITVVGETALEQLNRRLEARRLAYGGAIRALDAERISGMAAGDGFDLMLRQVPGLYDCETRSYPNPSTDAVCRRPRGISLSAGLVLEEFLVCIDGVASFSPGSDLRSIPAEEIAAFEYYGESKIGTASASRLTPTVGQAHVYTRQWMLSNAARPRSLMPVAFGC